MNADKIESTVKIAHAIYVGIPILIGAIIWMHRMFVKACTMAKALEKIQPFIDEIQPIIAEFKHNGGNSIKDMIARIDRRVSVIDFAQRAYWDIACDIPMFTADADGRLVWANRAYLELFKQPLSEMSGLNWELLIHQEDRDFVRDEWRRVIAEKTHFDLRYRSIDSYNIHCKAYFSGTHYVGFINYKEKANVINT